MSSNTILLTGVTAVALYYYYSTQIQPLVDTAGKVSDVTKGLDKIFGDIFTNPTPEQTEEIKTGLDQAQRAAEQVANDIKNKIRPGGQGRDRKDLPGWAQTVIAINDPIKELLGDVVISKIVSAAINESGTRAQIAQFKAEQARKARQEAAQNKLVALQEKKAKLAAMGLKKGSLNIEALKAQDALNKANWTIAAINQDKENLRKNYRAQFSEQLKLKYDADIQKARQEYSTKSQLLSSGKPGRSSLAIIKQRIHNGFAKVMNHTRASIGRQLASIRLPKFTTRGAVHSSASMFGMLVGAYDLVRMFDPRIDIWAGAPWRSQTGEAPAEEAPYTAPPPQPKYDFPLCEDAILSGVANPDKVVFCRANRPLPWEGLSDDGLTYRTACPPNYRAEKWGVYRNCVLVQSYVDAEYRGEWYDRDNWPSRASGWTYGVRDSGYDINTGTGEWNSAGDYVQGNHPTLYSSMPDDFFANLGLGNFQYDLANEIARTGGKNEHVNMGYPKVEWPTAETLPRLEGETDMQWKARYNEKRAEAEAQEKANRTPVPPAWKAGEAFYYVTPPTDFMGYEYTKGELNDPDFYFQQWKSKDDWGRGEGARVTLPRHLGFFSQPLSDIGLTTRGGENLTEAQKMAMLFPDATADEKDSAAYNTNMDEIQGGSEDDGSQLVNTNF